MKTYNKKLFISILIPLLLIMTIPLAAGQKDPVELGTASSFSRFSWIDNYQYGNERNYRRCWTASRD